MSLYHHTKSKGDIGVVKIIADLTSKNAIPCIPITEHAPFDLIMYYVDKTYTVQVKFNSITKKGVLEVDCRSIWHNKNGNHIIPFNKEIVDIIAVYCPDNDTCYYLNSRDIKNSHINLRIEEAKCKSPNIKWAKDYRDLERIL